MAQSKKIKDQSTSVKRMATSIGIVIKDLDWENSLKISPGISQADRDVLIKAVSILNKIGAAKTKIYKDLKSAELSKEEAIKSNEIEAKKIVSSWKLPDTNLDKVSLAIAGDFDYSLELYLKDGLPVFNREAEPNDWLRMLDELVRDSIKSIPVHAAYHAAHNNKSITDVMTEIERKLVAIKASTKALLLAKAWSAKINP